MKLLLVHAMVAALALSAISPESVSAESPDAPMIAQARTPTPVPTPTPRGTRGDLRDRRKRDDWDKNERRIFGDSEGAKAYDIEALRKEDAALTPTSRLAIYGFDSDAAGSQPAGFRVATTEGQAPGLWVVETSYQATSGKQIAAQRNANRADRYTALLLEKSPQARRVDVTARVWLEDAGKDQVAGLLVGSPGTAEGYAFVIDSKNNKVDLQRVVAGKGAPLENKDLAREALQGTRRIQPGRWYHLKMEYNTEESGRSELVGYLDGVKMAEARDNVFLEPGFAGLVTSSSTRAMFDTFTITLPDNWDGTVATPAPRVDAPIHSGSSSGECQQEWSWDFNELEHGAAVPGFTAAALGSGSAGEWAAMADDADNPRNVVQTSRIEDKNRFSGLLLDDPVLTDLEATVRVRTKSGKAQHRLAGIVFRQVDAQNYYYAGIHTGEDKLVLVRVSNGKHQTIETNKLNLKNNTWMTLKVVADGTNLRVMLDGDTKLRAEDNAFESGRVGLLTQSNTNAQFDDLRVCTYRKP